MDVVSAAITSAFTTIVASSFVMMLIFKKKETKYLAMESRAKELEKQIHVNEANYLERKNSIEIAYREEQKLLRNSVRLEGYDHGMAEGKKDHLIEITTLRFDHKEKISEERNLAAKEARSQARAEFELQSKLFSVVIRPYVKIERDDGYIWDSHKS